MQVKSYQFSVAPMMGYTHRHFIHFIRLITRHSLLFTEMLPVDAVCVNRKRVCDWNLEDSPIAVQIGGSDPSKLALASKIITDYGADEVNLNMGCPSSRVQKGSFGACLMLQPQRSAGLVAAMTQATQLPVTVKLRIGVDDDDTPEALFTLIALLRDAGASAIYLHARKALLRGLTPKENRNVPPLRYDIAQECKSQFPDYPIILNGGILTLEHAQIQGKIFDGVMVGREIIRNPFAFAAVDSQVFFGNQSKNSIQIPTREDVFMAYLDYMQREIRQCEQQYGDNVRYLETSLRHFLLQPLFAMAHGRYGAKFWRQTVNHAMHETSLFRELADMRYQLIAMDSQER